jgi:hypothetical protein
LSTGCIFSAAQSLNTHPSRLLLFDHFYSLEN